MGVRSNSASDIKKAMKAQMVPSARIPRIRSCRKRTYIGDDDTSPEIDSSTSKKAKPPSAAAARTAKTPTKKTAKLPSVVENAPTPVGVTKEAAAKVPRKIATARRERACKRGSESSIVSPAVCQPKKVNTKAQALRTDDAGYLSPDDCTYEQKDTWPLKYSPNVFGEFVGNRSAVETVERWLMEWKVASKKTSSRDSESSSSSNMLQETSSSALFIKGPPGVGKTCLVYYLAKKLGFTVLEVNSSSERPGKRVLADLQEATQSQHVEGTKVAKGGINAFFKPTLTPSSIAQTPVQQASSTKSKKKPKTTVLKDKRTTLKNFFSPVTPKTPIEETPMEKVEEVNIVEDKKPPKSSIKAFFAASTRTSKLQSSEDVRGVSESPEILTQNRGVNPAETGDGKIKCSSSTIILFDDVDVIFDDEGDEGFWMALETVLKSSKKPCILTATRGYEGVLKKCRSLQNAPLVELHRPSPSHVASLITSVCAAENRDLTDYNVEFMCQYLASDVRRSLIQMEFETVSPGHLQTVYPANKTMGGLMTSGSTEDAVGIQISFKKVGFNALYASLEDCLPFEFDDISLDRGEVGANVSRVKKRSTKFEAETVKDLSRIFDEFSINDIFTGCLTRIGEECLPSYERAKRWMKQRPMESQDSNQRIVEELLELSSIVLLGTTSVCSKNITERFAVLDANERMEQRLCRVTSGLGFHKIHKELKKVRISESCLDDILELIPIRQGLAFDYLGYLKAICCAENEKREYRRGNRFSHYLSNIGIFFTPEQLKRIADFWS